MQTVGYAVDGPREKFHLFQFQRRNPTENDVVIEILWAGICHSDIHQARDEWGGSIYPMVPGHEIVGNITQVGSKVNNFKVGDIGGVTTFVDSCRSCDQCKQGDEHFCTEGPAWTYNAREMDKKTPTYGGYSTQIVVDQAYVVKVSPKLKGDLKSVAPLLCAGITTYSPLKLYEKLVKGGKVGVVGLGGLGHMAVKFAAAMGGEVTVFSTSANKEGDAKSLGAKHFVNTKEEGAFKNYTTKLDIIIDTVAADHPIQKYFSLLRPRGVLALVGAPPDDLRINAFALIAGNKILTGSNVGGIRETQEMMDFCAEHNITSNVEVISVDQVETAFERTIKSDVKYRFVIDIESLKKMK